ncbi:MAG TPA: hypothetical protein VMU07_02005 [Candidatus Paceibacterota bacterium]|nr:hypothetical protein [Candidatus Paceibacterota bacterium]
MPIIPKFKPLHWTSHAKAKMMFYRLGPGRIRRVLHSPKRVEEGVAPRTVAMMQPASIKNGKWTQEIWVMFQDSPKERNVISAWRYPGVTKPRGEIKAFLRREYQEFLAS